MSNNVWKTFHEALHPYLNTRPCTVENLTNTKFTFWDGILGKRKAIQLGPHDKQENLILHVNVIRMLHHETRVKITQESGEHVDPTAPKIGLVRYRHPGFSRR